MNTTKKLPWYLCQHSAYVRDRFFSGGWEFETRQEACDYVAQQFAHQTPENLRNTPFKGEVRSNGLAVTFYSYGRVSTRTYRQADGTSTMRDLVDVPSPTDCVWFIPGTVEQ